MGTMTMKRTTTAKQREQLRLAREEARERRLVHVRSARYWLKWSRNEVARGDSGSALHSALTALYDRTIAHDYGTLVRKYEQEMGR